ncbi:UNVERIFIED_ORG: glycerophosphoryl diester phosphodiesterase [Arthrobacter globiformis]|nr:glycerophosphoryl diester phosphodiesterase [Arthrobacter globiformis]
MSTLELDTHLTEDGKVIVWHDDTMQANKCADTAPATPNDPEFPYAGDRVAELSPAQIKTLNCGYAQLVRDSGANKIHFNVETKVEDGQAGRGVSVALTQAVVTEIYMAGMSGRTTVQSFDWSTLNYTRKIAPQLPVVALSSGDAWLQVGKPGAAPELGGIDIDDYDGSLAKVAKALGYDVISPTFRSVTPQMIAEAHEYGLPVIPWTVNTTADMARLMDLGVDGIITDYPTRLRTLMDQRGLKLPKAYGSR